MEVALVAGEGAGLLLVERHCLGVEGELDPGSGAKAELFGGDECCGTDLSFGIGCLDDGHVWGMVRGERDVVERGYIVGVEEEIGAPFVVDINNMLERCHAEGEKMKWEVAASMVVA